MESHSSSSSTMYASIANTANEFDPRRVSAELKRLCNYYLTPKMGTITTPTTSTSMTVENTDNLKDCFKAIESSQKQLRLPKEEQHQQQQLQHTEFDTTGININTEISRHKHTFQDINKVPIAQQESSCNVHQNLIKPSSSSTLSSCTKSNSFQQNQSPCSQILKPQNSSTTNSSGESNDKQKQEDDDDGGISSLFSSGWKKENLSEESALKQNKEHTHSNSVVDLKRHSQSKTTSTNELRRESNVLLTIHHPNNNKNNNDNRTINSNEATIFDLRFEDRQRIANLISQLANSQEQVEILEYRVQKHEEHSRRKINDLMKKVELLSDRCKFLVVQNASKLESNKCVIKQRKKRNEDIENRLKQFQEQNQQLTFQLNQTKGNNTNLKHTLSVVESKYHRCVEDNQRLKFILKKIQEREEILLTHNKCYLNSEEEDKKKESQETLSSSVKPPDFQTEILKPIGVSSSFVSSQPCVSETVNEDGDEGEKSHLQQLRKNDGTGNQLEKRSGRIQNRNKSAGDFCTNNNNNNYSSSRSNKNNKNNYSNNKNEEEEEFHEYPVYEPHLIIPSMNSPVIMKIPKSPIMMKGRFSVPPIQLSQNYYQTSKTKSGPRPHGSRIPPNLVNEPTTQSLHLIEENNNEIYTENREESILRELFFTF